MPFSSWRGEVQRWPSAPVKAALSIDMIGVTNTNVKPGWDTIHKIVTKHHLADTGSTLCAGRPSELSRKAGSEEVDNSIVDPRKANPSKDGDAKPRVYVSRGAG
jgi:hypothetical protein